MHKNIKICNLCARKRLAITISSNILAVSNVKSNKKAYTDEQSDISNKMQTSKKQTVGKKTEIFNIILEGTNEALAGRAWLVLSNPMTAVVHAFVKRNLICSAADLEYHDILKLLDDILKYFKDRFDDGDDAIEQDKIQDTIKALTKTRKRRNKMAHNDEYFDVAHYKNGLRLGSKRQLLSCRHSDLHKTRKRKDNGFTSGPVIEKSPTCFALSARRQ